MATFKIGSQKAKRIINIGSNEDLDKTFEIQTVDRDILNISPKKQKKEMK